MRPGKGAERTRRGQRVGTGGEGRGRGGMGGPGPALTAAHGSAGPALRSCGPEGEWEGVGGGSVEPEPPVRPQPVLAGSAAAAAAAADHGAASRACAMGARGSPGDSVPRRHRAGCCCRRRRCRRRRRSRRSRRVPEAPGGLAAEPSSRLSSSPPRRLFSGRVSVSLSPAAAHFLFTPVFPGVCVGEVLGLSRTAEAATERDCSSGSGVPGQGGEFARENPSCCRSGSPPAPR